MNYKESRLFILRRCLWLGRAQRSDVLRAFGKTASAVTASRAIDDAVHMYPSIIARKPKWVEKINHAKIPDILRPLTDARCMMRLIQSDENNFKEIGLLPNEINFVKTRIRHNVLTPFDSASHQFDIDPILDIVLRASILNERIDILYVGLKVGEKARWRSVTPVVINDFDGQWRVYAHDLESSGFPLKHFVIPRILDARISFEKNPKKLHLQTGTVKTSRYHVTLNPEMTSDQKKAIGRELGINKDGEIFLSDDALFDFKKKWLESSITGGLSFGANGANSAGQNNGAKIESGGLEQSRFVWPLITDLEKK